jgi:hypothetical protein
MLAPVAQNQQKPPQAVKQDAAPSDRGKQEEKKRP